MSGLQSWLFFPLDEWPFVFIALAITFAVHEFAHAWFAYRFGDLTAKNEGRVTLNPRRHLDIIGTLLVFVAGFGWAKPVPVNRNNFRYPRLMGIIVSFAGPFSNFLLGVLTLIVIVILRVYHFDPGASGINRAIQVFVNHFYYLNFILMTFNLLPLPPLDGYRIVEDLAPARWRVWMDRHAQWGMVILLLIVFIPKVRDVVLAPLFRGAMSMMNGLLELFLRIAG